MYFHPDIKYRLGVHLSKYCHKPVSSNTGSEEQQQEEEQR